jgi:mersacidin/lichenicidin family type 2 lantibiotic
MNPKTIIRAWKDPAFRASLSSEERASLPECPAGTSITELGERDLDGAVGGGLPGGQTRLNKVCFPVLIKRPWEPLCALSRDPVLQDPLSLVINPVFDLQLAR